MTEPREDNEIKQPGTEENGYIVKMDYSPDGSVFQGFSGDAEITTARIVSDGIPPELSPILERAFLFLEDGEWAKADEYCERVLDRAPRTAAAYLGKYMAEKRIKTLNDLPGRVNGSDKNGNYRKALRFAPPELADKLNGYARNGTDSAEHPFFTKRSKITAAVLLPTLAVLLAVFAAVWFGVLCPKLTFEKEAEALGAAVIGDIVVFGDHHGELEWTVLEKDETGLLLLGKTAVGMCPYTEDPSDVSWENSMVRAWLNADFYETAFSKYETALIRESEVCPDAVEAPYDSGEYDAYGEYDDYDEYGSEYYEYYGSFWDMEDLAYDIETREERGVRDRIYILSRAECNRDLKTESARKCEPAGYLREEQDGASCEWWLRACEDGSGALCSVDADGAVIRDQSGAESIKGVRPVMRVALPAAEQ